MRQRKTQLKLETEMAKAEIEELVYERADRETSAKLLPEREENKKSISFLQPLATLYEDGSTKDESAAVEAKPDVHEPIKPAINIQINWQQIVNSVGLEDHHVPWKIPTWPVNAFP